MSKVETHPLQNHHDNHKPTKCPTAVTLRAYEVYKELYGPQEALIHGWCRGGFSVGELVGYLYAYGFPREEWKMRVEEAWNGMENL